MTVKIDDKYFTVFAKVGLYDNELESIFFYYDKNGKKVDYFDESDLTEEQLEAVIEEAIEFRDDYLAERKMDAMEDIYD